jgi:tetratricopeptide (TPR) repeat protein
MIEATCGACGTVARIAEADVPVGAKFVTCASCKSRVALPQKAGAKPPVPPGKPPAIPGKPPVPSNTIDLADLPAPKRNSALAGAEPSKPASKSPLAGAELPAPKSAKPPAAAPGALDLDDLMPAELPAPKSASAGLADLPAPKRASALGDAPASKPVASALADLPAPKAKASALADLPAPKAKPSALADLPAPKKPADKGGLDLDLPAPKKGGLDLDLPAPKKGGLDLDLPAPTHEALGLSLDGDLDLPAPKAGLGDLPAPKAGLGDLPAPKAGLGDLPAPKPGANNDLPAPKGFFDDLPQPAKKTGGGGNADLPAPKGFFDDLPGPTSGKTDLPAPKQQGGFFDDLPAPAKPAAPAKGGFFDDLPQPAKGGKPGTGKPAAAGGAKPASVGLFDDLEQPGGAGGPDDIQLAAGDIDLGPSSNDRPLELEGGSELDLGLPLGSDQSFTDLDLSEPTTGKKPPSGGPPDEEASPIKIKTPGKGGKSTPIAITVKKEGPTEIKLDLADDPHAKGGGAPAVAAAGGAAAKQKAKKVERTPEEIAAEAARKKKRTRVLLASVLGIALVGAGGFYFYDKHTKEQARKDKIAEQIGIARKQLGESAPQHWQRASTAAQSVLEIAPNDGVALGLAAEAALAGALDNGVNFDARVKAGRSLAQQGLGAGKSGPELERAQALMNIASNAPDRALPILQKLLAKSPKDGWLQLYTGWAQLQIGDADAALKSFDAASASTPNTKIAATYGVGKAKLLKADIEGARAAFAQVLEATKGQHIGAQVGLTATLPPQQSAQKEAELMAVLENPEVKANKADPRAVVTAYDLAGDIARTSGRLDIARERYRKAITISKADIPAHVGLAKVELKDGKVQVARDLITKALAADANNAEVQLLAAELDIVDGKLPDAGGKIEKLEARKPPLPPLLAARLHLITGRLFEAQGKDAEAITEYTEGAKLAGELDLTPTMAAVTKLSELAKKESDPAKAEDFRKRANDLLSALAERAKEDGELSLTLGIAYLQAGDAVKAEDSLRRATTLREKDPESKLQLAKALLALGRVDEAISQLKEALELDPKRQDVALELARTYQLHGKDTEAMAAYDKLLADPAVPLVVRSSAGRWFATKGARDKAAAQADAILAVEPENAAGLYLKGEGLMLGNKWDEARSVLTKASDSDPDAQYFDALGRAFEGSFKQSGDTKYIESARYAYERAAKTDPKLFHAQLGLGHMLVESGKWEEAIKALTQASSLDKSNSETEYWMGLAFFGVRNQSPAHRKTAADWLEASMKGQPPLPAELRADAYWRLGQLYVDLNKAGDAARTMEAATKMGEEQEKQTGKGPAWLTELYFDLGDMYYKLNNKPAQKRAFQRYVDRKPKPGSRLTEAQRSLATELQRY